VLILAAFVLLSNACEPDPDPEPEPGTSIEFNINDETHPAAPVQTVLDKERVNPYTVDNMTQATDNVYGVSRTGGPVPTTNLYVKFTPSSLDDIEAMYDTDETFYDFPLTREVVTMGDYYQDLADDEFPELYAVVPPNFQFPSVAYEILAPLHIAPYDTYLVQEAFALTNNTYDGLSTQTSQSFTICEIDDPNYPQCTCDQFIGNFIAYDECIANLTLDNDNDTDPPPPTDNSCTNPCATYGHERKPAGRVRVEDTQLSTPRVSDTYEPVRRVKIIMKDTWFTEDETWTDDCGCWRINDKYRGKAWMWVKFKNDRCRIRGTTANWRVIYQWAIAVKDYVGVINGPNFDNINVNYELWADQGSPAHIYWGAATVNNALHEFHDYAVNDGIDAPPTRLDMFVGRNVRFGYAFMPHFMGPQLTNYALGNGLEGNHFSISPFGVLLSVFSPLGIANQFFPDVFVGINFDDSDDLKSLAYHEIAHASHYSNVGAIYWSEVVAAEVAADGHGDLNSNDAGRIACVESWAEYLGGHHYVHRTYGVNTSLGETWEARLERTWNETPAHIPIGLHHDLVDIGEAAIPWDAMNTACNQLAPGCTAIPDFVEGFTNAQMFQSLGSNVTTIDQYRIRLTNNHLGTTTNTAAEVDLLFSNY